MIELETLDKLKIFNNPNFKFFEKSHTYSLDKKELVPVTNFIKKFKVPFDEVRWSQKKASERGISVEEILKEWKDLADSANALGTLVHNWIEEFYKGEKTQDQIPPEILDRIQKFLTIKKNRLDILDPIIFEQRVFSLKWGLAGTFDALFSHMQKDILVGDWKTNKEFRDDNHPKGRYQKMLYPFSDLWDNHYNLYSVQTSLYRLILKEEAGIETSGSFLCHIGPDTPAKIYKCLDLTQRLKEYLDNENKDIFSL